MRNNLLVAFLFCAIQITAFGQQVVNHHAVFSSGQQNMWGPSFSAITLDQTITLFDVPWDVNYDTGNAGIVTVVGQSFGAGVSGSFSGVVGSEITIEGFTSGTVEVDYPVDIELNMPTDLTYDQGDNVVIQTDYTMDPGWNLETLYPSAGEFFWDFYFRLSAGLSAEVCVFSCTTFPIIPFFDTGVQTINLATISSNGASTGGEIGAWFLGPGQTPPYVGGLHTGVGIWPYALPVETSPSTSPINFIPWQCYIGPGFPAEIPGGMGLSGEITIPYVPTTDALSGLNLSACGDSTYFNLNLEIFQLLGGILSNVPGPVGAFGTAISYLSGSETLLGLVDVNWTIFSASFDANITNKQCFDFTPKVYGRYQFPVVVDYQIINTSGVAGPWRQGSIINILIGEDIRYKFPCYFDSLSIVPTYTIDGVFRNHTWDSVSFDFLMSAFEFGLSIPPIVVVPGFTIPEICLPIPYPCPTWSNPFRWCTTTVCTPEIVVPPIGWGGLEIGFGPLWSTSIPIGGFEYDWFDQTWSLEGFTPQTFPGFAMKANKLSISKTSNNILCFGGLTGTVNATVSAVSHATPYVYTWTNGSVTSTTATSNSITGLGAGNYDVSVIDANGCQLFTGATIAQPPLLEGSVVVSDITCNGAGNGQVVVDAFGGAIGAYSYNIGGVPQASNTFSGLGQGPFNVVVTDVNGCQITIPGTINEPSLLTQSAAITHVSCFGGNDGAIDASVGGGTLPYTFLWSTGANSTDISGLVANTYELTVKDAKMCSTVVNYPVLQPLAPVQLTAIGTDILCKGGNNGIVDVTTTGGTPGYTYQWTSQVNGILPFVTEDITNMFAGTYTVVATDTKGCRDTLTQVLVEPAARITSVPTLTHINCFGDATGAINPGIQGGTSPYFYSWSNGATTSTIAGLIAGTYTLNVTDNNGCMEMYSYTLNQPAAGLGLVLSKTDVNCFGDATGSVTATVSGGTAPYSYAWNTGATTTSITNLVAANYSVLVTDSKGCTINDNINVIEPIAPLSLTSVVTDVDCHGNNSGSVDVTINGGTAPYNHYWSNSGTIVMIDTTEDITNQYADTYTLLVTDSKGCQETIISTIDEPIAPLAITGIIDDANCFGLNDGAIDITVTGGTTTYTYLWSNGAVTEDISGMIAGNYVVTITDLNGCTLNKSFDIAQPLAPINIVLLPRHVSCNADNDGYIKSTVSGGTAPYTYSWSNGMTVKDIYNLTAGVYTLTITDAQGCIAFTGVTIEEPTALVVNAAVLDASCYSYSDGEIVLTVSGGVEPYYFNWGNQNEILLNNPSETLSNLPADEYFIRVRDANGCINEQIVNVFEPTPFISTSVVTDATCYGGTDGMVDVSITGGTLPYASTWSDGQLTEDAVNLSQGNYTYTIIDGQGCEISEEVFVDQPDLIQISYDLVEVTCIDQTDGALYISPYGGVAPYTYNWSTGSMEQNAEGLAPGDYDLTITDDNLCTQNFLFTISMSFDECLTIPNTFTPNKDDYNDTWIIGNIDLYPNATVKVFNKWGNEMYSTSGNYIPWDGKHNGNDLPSDVYYYVIVLGNQDQNEYTGTITIIR